jgi:putative tricarboxylic transport membrane protein
MSRKGLFMSLADWTSQAVNMVRSSVIGTWVGILPGVGANIGSIIAYTTAKNMSKRPERFGTGAEEGIVASEAANNATVGGALIPLIALGIPGSVIDAVLLGALLVHGVQPGPLLFVNRPDVAYTIMAACLVSNVVMFIVMTGAVGFIAKIMYMHRGYMLPAIFVLCVIGTYSLTNTMFDVWVMLIFGLIGYGLERAGVPLGPFVIGFILAPIAEASLRSGLMISGGSYLPIISRPFSLIFVLLSLAMLVWPLYKEFKGGRRAGP